MRAGLVRDRVANVGIAEVAERAPVTEADPEPAPEPRELTPGSRIGLLGGTFDPPHLGHLVLAAAAVEQLGLERVVFIPAGAPPHKRDVAVSSSTDRLLLTRLAIAGEPSFELSVLEIERPGVSYTIETVEEMARTYGDATRLTLVMASDSFATIETWREPDRLLELTEWAIGPRPGYPLPSRDELSTRWGRRHARIHLLDAPPLGISSSDLRARVAAGRSIRYLVPRAVEDQIALRRLYQRSA